MSIEPRLIERRKTVAEDNAKRNVSRLLKFIAVVVVAGGLVWLVFSPWLSVSMVTTSGIETGDGHATLADHRVVAGTPMILISAPRVEQALLTDPWVVEAKVRLDWPDEVIVEVVERDPVAWVQTENGWSWRALDGVALLSSSEPDDEMARIEMPWLADNEAPQSVELLGALEFVESLPEILHQGTVVTRNDDEIWATVAGFQVRLGRAVDMGEKALSLNALLAVDPPAGSTLVLIAPTNPSHTNPDQGGTDQVEGGDVASGDDGEEGAGDPDGENGDS